MDGDDQIDLNTAFDRAAGDPACVTIDTEKYATYLDDPSLSDAQKAEIVEALWSIIVAFVELGFGVEPAYKPCGQVEIGLDRPASLDSDGKRPDGADI